jgi:SAM-dependent methyltransferase
MSEWQTAEHALAYLDRADRVPLRVAGEAALLEEIPPHASRALDVGAGDGRLLDLVLRARPHARGVALDFSPITPEPAREVPDRRRGRAAAAP